MSIQLSANGLGKTVEDEGLLLGSLSLTWETWMKPLAPTTGGPNALAITAIWTVKQKVEDQLLFQNK